MKRILLIAAAVVPLLLTAPVASADSGQPGGNSAAAHSCQQGGYATYHRADGSSFANTGECVSYAAHGGQLLRPAFIVVMGPAVDGSCQLTVSYSGLAPLSNYTLVVDDNPDLLPSTIPFTTDSTGSYVFLTTTIPQGTLYFVNQSQLYQAGSVINSTTPFALGC